MRTTNITPGFGSGNESEIWTKEKIRLMQFYQVEMLIMEAEIKQDYIGVVNACRVYLRLLMEPMIEDKIDEETNKKTKSYGIDTNEFKKLRDELIEIEDRLTELQKRNTDPATQINNKNETTELIRRIKTYEDKLFFLNTKLGINYKRKDVFEAWKD